MLSGLLLAILLASRSITGSSLGWKKSDKSEKRKSSMRIQLPTILSSRRHSDGPPSDRASSVSERSRQGKVSFERPNVTELMEKLQNSNPDTVGNCGRSNSQSDSSGSSQPAPIVISLLPDSPVPKKKGLFRKESRKNRSTSVTNDSSKSEISPVVGRRSKDLPSMAQSESPRIPEVPPKKSQEEISCSSQSSNIGPCPSNEDLSVTSPRISPDVQHRLAGSGQSLSESSQTQKRRMYRTGRQGSASTSAIKRFEPIRVKRVGSASNSPRNAQSELKKTDSIEILQMEKSMSKSFDDSSSSIEKVPKHRERKQEMKHHNHEMENANLQLLIEQLVTNTVIEQEDKPKVKRKPTRKSMKRRSVSLNNADLRMPAVNISLAPEPEDHRDDSIAKLIDQLHQSDPALNRKSSTQKKRQREALDASARLRSPRGRSADSSPRRGSSRSTSRSKRSTRSKSRDPDINLMIESLKNSSDDSIVIVTADDERVEMPLADVPEPKEIKKMIKSLKSSVGENKDQEEQAAIENCLNSLKDFEAK